MCLPKTSYKSVSKQTSFSAIKQRSLHLSALYLQHHQQQKTILSTSLSQMPSTFLLCSFTKNLIRLIVSQHTRTSFTVLLAASSPSLYREFHLQRGCLSLYVPVKCKHSTNYRVKSPGASLNKGRKSRLLPA